MIGFVLAAGFGTRLSPLTEHVPKALVPVGGKPLLERNLEFLQSLGISSFCVNSHYLHEQMERFRRLSTIPFELFFEQNKIRGTGGALFFARDFLTKQDTFLVMNVDIVCRFDLRGLIEEFRNSELSCLLCADKPRDRGTILFDRETFLYRGTPSDTVIDTTVTGADFIGVALYKRSFLDTITPEDFSIVPIWKRAVENGKKIGVHVAENLYWKDIGTPGALASIHFDVLDDKIDLKIPGQLKIDRSKKICVPSGFTGDASMFGHYTWLESNLTEEAQKIACSIILENADCRGRKDIENKIVTEWGDIPFEYRT